MQITLTLELTAKNLDKLKVFCQETNAAFGQTEKKSPGKTAAEEKTAGSQTEQKQEPMEAQEKNPDEDKTETKKTFTLTDVRAVALKLSKAGKSDTLKEIFAKFGAAKLSEVPKDKYAELMEELTNA